MALGTTQKKNSTGTHELGQPRCWHSHCLVLCPAQFYVCVFGRFIHGVDHATYNWKTFLIVFFNLSRVRPLRTPIRKKNKSDHNLSKKNKNKKNGRLSICAHIYAVQTRGKKKQIEIGKIERGIRHLSVFCITCLLYTSPSPRDATLSRMPSSA